MKKNTDYSAKNKVRKEFYDPGVKAHREARKLRRLVDGAFGREKGAAYNEMVAGTSGSFKKG
jgi:hypothetical protein